MPLKYINSYKPLLTFINVGDEDRIKAKLYAEFQKSYFREHPKRLSLMSPKEKEEFFREQRKYVEEEYIKRRYKK